MTSITLSASIRQNLLSLQNTTKLLDSTSNRLSTGLKVNSALDNPAAFFAARSLTNRANDLTMDIEKLNLKRQKINFISNP